MANSLKNLVLQVDADTGNLKRNLRDGVNALIDFGKSADDVQAAFQKNLSSAGNFDPTAMVKIAQRNIDTMIKTMRAQAKSAMDMGSDFNPLGGMNSGSTLQAAAAQEKLAASYRIQAEAARLASGANEGQTLAIREVMLASVNLATEAERQAVNLRGQAGAFAAVETEMRRLGMTAEETADHERHLTEGHGRTSIAGMEMMHVMRATSDSFAAGLPPITIFTEQLGRVTDAMGFMAIQSDATTGFMGKFAGFMSGGWGFAVIGGVSLLGALVSKTNVLSSVTGDATSRLAENAKALDDVKAGDNGLADAQKALGDVFDLTTGKLKSQNELLQLNARLTGIKLRAEGLSEQAQVKKTEDNFGNGINPFNLGTQPGRANARRFLQGWQDGSISSDKAMQAVQTLDLSGTGTSKEEFMQMILAKDSSKAKLATADAIDKSLNTGALDPTLRDAPKKARTKRAPKDRTADNDTAYDDAIAKDNEELAKLSRDGVTDAQALAVIDKRALAAAYAKQQADDDKSIRDHKFDPDQAAALRGGSKSVYDARVANIDRDTLKKVEIKQLDDQIAILTLADQELALKQQLAPTLAERADIAKQILANEKEIAQLGVVKGQTNGTITSSEARVQNAATDQTFADKTTISDKANADPVQKWKQGIKDAAGDMNTSLKSVEANGLHSLEDGLVGIIDGTETAAEAFKKMAASIIADLARVAVEHALFAVIGLSSGGPVPGKASGGLLGFAGGGIPGFAGGSRSHSGMIGGPGSGTSDSILALVNGRNPIMVSSGEGIVNARAVRKFWPQIDAMNKGTFPGFADGGALDMTGVHYPALPSAASLRQMAPNTPVLQFDLRGAVMTADLVAQFHVIAAQYSTVALAASPDLAQAQLDERAAQQIPS